MKFTMAHVTEICRPGKLGCCRYLVCGASGFECAKKSTLKPFLDERVKAGTMRAVGDNCEGFPAGVSAKKEVVKNADGVEYETPYAVICEDTCGLQALTEEQYRHAMARPNQSWICPQCGGFADWDDRCPTTNPAE